jgi:hypothetical protein
MMIQNQSFIHEEIKSRLNLRNVHYLSEQNFLFCLLYETVKIKLYHTDLIQHLQEAGVVTPGIMTVASAFYIVGHEGCFADCYA